MAAPVADMPAAFAAASVIVSAAIQPEGVQRAILEGQAMARPVIVSDLGAGADVVLTAPAVPESRIAGFRFPVRRRCGARRGPVTFVLDARAQSGNHRPARP